MLTMLGIPNCDTVRKARKHLEQMEVGYAFRDLRKQPLTADEWHDLVIQDKTGNLLNRRSPTFRKTGKVAAELDSRALAELLTEHPTAVKRPVILAQSSLVSIGYSQDRFAAFAQA